MHVTYDLPVDRSVWRPTAPIDLSTSAPTPRPATLPIDDLTRAFVAAAIDAGTFYPELGNGHHLDLGAQIDRLEAEDLAEAARQAEARRHPWVG